MHKVVNAIAGPRNNTRSIHTIDVKNDVIDQIDPTGFLIGNDSRKMLARYLVISVDGKEIKQGNKITIKMKNKKIKLSLSIRNEVFNSKGKKNGEGKFEIAGKLKNMVALLKFLRSLAESAGVITSNKAQGVGFFIVCNINPAKNTSPQPRRYCS